MSDQDLIHIDPKTALVDVDDAAWQRVRERRGGCRCHLSPPCGACSDPITEQELNDVGYTYEKPGGHCGADARVEGQDRRDAVR